MGLPPEAACTDLCTEPPGRLRLGPPRFVVPVAALLGAGSSSDHENGAEVVEVTGSTAVARALDPAVVTAADMVAGHVRLDISCLDRVYLTGFIAGLQTPGGVVYFFHEHPRKPNAAPALFEPNGAKFRADLKDWALASGSPVIPFRARGRKADA